jgi:hypothetical protein
MKMGMWERRELIIGAFRWPKFGLVYPRVYPEKDS